MACPAILTGDRFLWSMLAHIDCQAQTIGSYGYGALADPGSTVSVALSGLLTLFVALFGVRLILGHSPVGADLFGDFLRVAIVLTLATSWPAWRIIGYDLVMTAPSEIARTIGASSGLPDNEESRRTRLQYIDDGLVAMTVAGTGRMSSPAIDGNDPTGAFRSIALPDETGLGWGRVLFLAGTIGPYAVVRLGAGILLALTPLIAGALLFGGTVGLFVGWARGLAFSGLGAVGLSLVQGVQLAILGPWLADVLALRDQNSFTPSAPTELIVLSLAFCAISVGVLILAARVAFQPHFAPGRLFARAEGKPQPTCGETPSPARPSHAGFAELPSRAYAIGQAVAATTRQEEGGHSPQPGSRTDRMDASKMATDYNRPDRRTRPEELLGSSFRRTRHRASAVGERRDRKA
ncbi:MAG TPA: type IV secretion system protein [Sphingobium sp.]